MQIQGNTDLATSPHPCERDGANLPIKNLKTLEGKKGYWGVIKGVILPNQTDSFL